MKRPIDEAKEDFYNEIMPVTKKSILGLITETDKDHQKQCRIEYLKDRMADLIVEVWKLMDQYEDYFKRERVIERLLTGKRLQATVKEILKLQSEIMSLKNGKKGEPDITEDMIRRAKDYPFIDLLEFRNKQTLCPFHDDKNPSMYLYEGDNRVFCFGCNQGWDTIGFVMQKEGLSFKETIRKLC